jgi:signal transduction histidine kinase/ActR/RegA family two-component response regulator/PAS domain-containing protein
MMLHRKARAPALPATPSWPGSVTGDRSFLRTNSQPCSRVYRYNLMVKPSQAGQLARACGGLLVVALLLAVVLATCWLLYEREAGQIGGRQAELEVVRVNLLAQLLRSELRPAVDDLRLLADGDGFRTYLETGEDKALQAAVRRAVFFSVEKPLYDQVRYLDQNGQEVFRVSQGGRVVPGPQLQNKSDRPYFKQANVLPPGTLSVSSFDLNIEGPRQTNPPKPTLRFAVPVFDAAGRRRGVYIINCLGENLIASMQKAAAILFKRVRLLNASGYWLKGASPGEEWGFLLPERAAFTVARTDPTLWAQMQRNPTGQSPDAGGLITWRRVLPAEFTGMAGAELHADEAFLIVASAITAPEWDSLFSGLRQIMLLAAAALVVLTLISATLFRGRLQAMRTLRALNEQLELRVQERTRELAHSYELLQQREQLLEETGTLAKVGGWDLDPTSGAGNWTPEVARIHDLDPALIADNQLRLQSYPGESGVRLQAAIKEAFEHGVPYDLDLEFVSARGVRKWVRTICRPIMRDGKVRLMRGALQDITEQKLSQFRLQAQLARLHMLEHITRAIGERQDLASILQVVVRTLEAELPLDFSCICLYEPTERTLTVIAVGLASAELAQQLSMSEHARIPIDENGLSRCVRGKLVYEAQIDGLPFPFPRRLASGGLRALVAAPLQIESQVFGVLISARRQPNSFSSGECEFLRQLSEHVALAAHQAQLHTALQTAYEELRSTQQAVMQQERLRVLGQMASGIAHDINNAISPIMLYTDSMLEKEPGLSERGRGYLHTIQQAASDVAETVARMREFYRQRDIQTESTAVDLNEMVAQVAELTRARWESMPQQRGIVIDMRTELAARLPQVSGVKSEIREALTNLVFNAVDAMPQGGTLTLRTRSDGTERMLVEVIDTGVGMDEETRRRCLEPFFTTKGERGTGLGLAMVYGVVQRHGGDLEIDSHPGSGTTVRLSFAAAPAGTIAATDEIHAALPVGLTILLVDDDPILLRSLRETLELDGHTILTANDGKEGIDIFRKSLQPGGHLTVSAVITDLGMPHVDGRSVARAVKQASADTPVILLTGWGERLLAEGDTPPYVDRVLSKPPRLREVRKALAELTSHTAPLRARSGS